MADQGIALGEGLSPEMMAEVEAFAKDEGIEIGEGEATKSDSGVEALEEPSVIKDVPAEAEAEESTPAAFDFSEIQKTSGLTKQELLNKLLDDQETKLTIKRKGKEEAINFHDIKTAMGRVESLQKQVKELTNSDDAVTAAVIKAAKDGDKSAQARLKAMLVEFTGSEDADAMLDSLENVEDNFDADGAKKKMAIKAEWATQFADVEADVDFEENLAKIKSVVKPRMPEKAFNEYWDQPDSRRTMYDLVAFGIADKVLDAFDAEYAKLPFEKRLDLDTDPDAYGIAFASVVRSLTATSGTEEASETEDTPMEGISDGSHRGVKTVVKNDGPMTEEEYQAILKTHGFS